MKQTNTDTHLYLKVKEIKRPGKVLGVIRRDITLYDVIRERVGKESVLNCIQRQHVKWFVHFQRECPVIQLQFPGHVLEGLKEIEPEASPEQKMER